MPIDFTQRGYIEVWRDGVRISQHNREREAVERITIHASENGNGDYEIRHPLVVAKAYGVITPGSGDTEAPTAPGSVSAVATSATTGTVSWTASTDNIGVAGYQIFRDGAPLSTTTNLSFPLTGLSPSTQYSITVVAFDASGNNSSAGGPALFTTDPNSAPVWSLGNQAYETGNAVSIALDSFCTDADADTITYSLVSGTLPSGLALSGARNQTLSGTVDTVETAVFTLGASDGIAAVQNVALTFTITTPDTTAPAAPTGLTLAPGSTSVSLDWADNTETDLDYYEVWRSTDGVSFGRRTAQGVGVAVSSYVDAGANAATQYWYYVTAVDDSGNISNASSTENTTTLSSASNASRISSILAGRAPHFAYSTPADPVTTREVTVTTAAQFNTEAAVAQTRIVIGNSFSGNVAIRADDLDIVMSNAFTISGRVEVQLGGASPFISRVRWTGGNVGNIYHAKCHDFVLDDVYATAVDAYRLERDPEHQFGFQNPTNRIAIINSTLELAGDPARPSGERAWAIHTQMNTGLGDPTHGTDFFVGNSLFLSNHQTARFIASDNLMIVDSVFNPNGTAAIGPFVAPSAEGSQFRIHDSSTNVWIKDTWGLGFCKIDGQNGESTPQVLNARFDNWDRYNAPSGTYFIHGTVTGNTGTVLNSTLHGTGGTMNISPLTDGSGNSVVAYTFGDAVPDYSTVGAIRP